MKQIEPGSSSYGVFSGSDAGETFERCKPSLTIGSVLGLAKVYQVIHILINGILPDVWEKCFSGKL